MGNHNSSSDCERYRAGYPGLEDDPNAKDNLMFYKNQLRMNGNGPTIDEFHQKKFGDYHFLEASHSFIQWLFPIREQGMNYLAQPLQLHEAKAIKADPKCLERFMKSYELILDFYGMRLKKHTNDNAESLRVGEVERNPTTWKQQYDNLNYSSHNYLRITRILKCLGELGFEEYKLPWIEFMIKEVYEHKQLPNIKSSLKNYFVETLKNDEERKRMKDLIAKYDPSINEPPRRPSLMNSDD